MDNTKDKILEKVASIQNSDDQLAKEFQKIRLNGEFQQKARLLAPKLPRADEALEGIDHNFALETIVLRVGRPVLAISKDEAVLQFKDAESAVWKDRLLAAEPKLSGAIRSVGRVEVQNHPSYTWLGTGWLVDKEVIVTNRHVAEVFGQSNGSGFIFRQGGNGKPIGVSVDFLEEIDRPDEFTFVIDSILHIEGDEGPDIAFLKVKPVNNLSIPLPIKLSSVVAGGRQDIAVIGYPASDSRIPDQQLMTDLFGNVYDKKRLAPGQLTGVSPTQLQHDCSTLGGNSGSPLIDLVSGEAVGLHFAGRFLENNFAVPATLIAQRLKTAGRDSKITTGGKQEPPAQPVPDPAGTEDKEEFFTEGKPADYSDRKGYDSSFLGKKFKVPLPEMTNEKKKKDILKFNLDGTEQQILDYEHFSVLMSKSRRQCFFSAVNIDGKNSVPMKRGAWRLDPRIPADAQIMKECYGNSPKFSRGHMTRREDPIWGSPADAALGNTDSMHVTNTVPQVQGLNAGIWLSLENYALQNARKDDMRISVFTGPVCTSGDPVLFGIIIPRSFWKIIIFIHDETQRLCATGYKISQEAFLTGNEFIFGQHNTAQRKIIQIEKDTGLSFGELSAIDPFNTVDELPDSFLTDLEQIRFV